MPIQSKKAYITQNGIEVDGAVYTCSLSVKDQWYLKSLESGPVEIDFYVDSNKPDEGFIHFSVRNEMCFRVNRRENTSDLLEPYFEKMQMVKEIKSFLDRRSVNKGRGVFKKGE